jgi:hypothetical protein
MDFYGMVMGHDGKGKEKEMRTKGWHLLPAYDIVSFPQTARELHPAMLRKDG